MAYYSVTWSFVKWQIAAETTGIFSTYRKAEYNLE